MTRHWSAIELHVDIALPKVEGDKRMNRKRFVEVLAGGFVLGLIQLRGASPSVQVFKTPTCSCCGKWVQHLRDNGFQATVQEVPDTAPTRRKYGVPDTLQSCHTAVVDGYAVEGHVPAADIHKLLREKPKAKGLAVPGMPIGSPGMESTRSQAYAVLLFDAQGKTSVYHQYPAR